MNTAEEFLKEIFESEEYRSGLKARIIAGTAKPGELAIARSLGLQPVLDREEQQKRERMRAMPTHEREIFLRLARRMAGAGGIDPTPSRPIVGPTGSVGGLVFAGSEFPGGPAIPPDPTTAATEPETDATETDLLPKRKV